MFRSLLSHSLLDDRDLAVQLLGALDGPELALEVVDTQEWRDLDDVDDVIEAMGGVLTPAKFVSYEMEN